MKMIKQHRRLISLMIMGAFLCLVQVSAAPPTDEETLGSSEENAVVSVAGAEDGPGSGAIEKVETTAKVSKKKFPWLLVVAGVVAVGAVLYFTVLKKPKYTLSVTVGEGAEGTPIAGTVEYKKGTVVNYSFTAKTGYKKLSVTLDGAAVSDSGSITMNADHTLSVSATEGIEEQFTSSASSLWRPLNSGFWSVGGGYYKCNSTTVLGWESNIYDYRFSSNQFVYETKMRRTNGWEAVGQAAGLLTSTSSSSNGYLFVFSATGSFWILKLNNYNFLSGSGTYDWIKTSATSAAIHTGINQWNTIRITRSGSNYTLAINGDNVYTFSDTSHDVRYVAVAGGCFGAPNAWDYDYVIATQGSQLASAVPAAPAAVLIPGSEYNPFTGEREKK